MPLAPRPGRATMTPVLSTTSVVAVKTSMGFTASAPYAEAATLRNAMKPEATVSRWPVGNTRSRSRLSRPAETIRKQSAVTGDMRPPGPTPATR